MLLHAPTSAPPWTSELTRFVDALLHDEGSYEVPVEWTRYEYEDGDHFTDVGAAAFCEDLVRAVLTRCEANQRLWILSDSTIGHNDYDALHGGWTGAASARIAARLRAAGIEATVDAVCGSGFAAMSAEGEHFAARIAARRRCAVAPPDAVLFIGGWNDEGRGEDRLGLAISGACRAARACLRR